MADDELDLTGGTPAESREERRRKRRSSRDSGSGSGGSSGSEDGEVKGRMDRCLDRIAKWRREKGDNELAEAIEEDRQQLTGGFVAITGSFPWLRMPLIHVLNLVEPLLAFGRVARILIGRAADRWRMRQVRRAADAVGMTVEEYVAAGYPSPNGDGEEQPVEQVT